MLLAKLDLNAANKKAIKRLQKRIDDSIVPGSMLTETDVEAIAEDIAASIIEFALIAHAIAPDEDGPTNLVGAVEQITGMVVENHAVLMTQMLHFSLHEKPDLTN